ncbi:MAG: DUF4440 domain-containing protein [Deltaproteobacteria bacterium]|nr:DUF4440 domain-containing protein [Deltaproteobacteria bacterium]
MRALLFLVLAACIAAPATTTTTTTTPKPMDQQSELSSVLSSLSWLTGDWQGDEGAEHWIAADGAIYGVALQATGMFEVMIVDDGEGAGPADGVVRLIAMPGGAKAVEFRASTMTTRSARFDNPAHDAPKNITYERTPEGLRATLDVDGNRQITFTFRPSTRQAAPELEAADRAFASDTAAKGLDGLMSWFAPDGWMLDKDHTAKMTGADLRAAWALRFEAGTLTWTPIASGRSGKLGFTVGKGEFTGKNPAHSMRTTYLTIWKQQPDGAWKVLFDTGRAVNTP